MLAVIQKKLEEREQTLVTCVIAYLLSQVILEEGLLTGYKISQQCLAEQNRQEKQHLATLI